MRIAFFSDIHGNLPALEIAIKEAGDVDGYIVLGDVVNYGPWTNECVNMLETLPHCIKIRGNHEDFFINGKCDSDDYLANEFFNHCYENFSELFAIQMYKSKVQFEEFICIHTIDNKYIYEDSEITIKKNYIRY